MFAESFFESSTSLSDILHFTIFTFHVRTYIKSFEFQSRSELLTIENCLPLTDEVTVDLVLKMLATFTPLGIALRNIRVYSTSFERISIFTKNR